MEYIRRRTFKLLSEVDIKISKSGPKGKRLDKIYFISTISCFKEIDPLI
jgi:hypothetical protein